jgi:hypothetical protein
MPNLRRSILVLPSLCLLAVACESDAGEKACERYYDALEICAYTAGAPTMRLSCESVPESEADVYECMTQAVEDLGDCGVEGALDPLTGRLVACAS